MTKVNVQQRVYKQRSPNVQNTTKKLLSANNEIKSRQQISIMRVRKIHIPGNIALVLVIYNYKQRCA